MLESTVYFQAFIRQLGDVWPLATHELREKFDAHEIDFKSTNFKIHGPDVFVPVDSVSFVFLCKLLINFVEVFRGFIQSCDILVHGQCDLAILAQ